jgi:hypothetical protein
MNHSKDRIFYRTFPIVMVGVTLGGITQLAFAADTPPTQRELMAELKALRAKVDQLEARQSNQEKRFSQAEVDAAVTDVLRDSNKRSKLLEVEGFTAGHDKGRFILQSADGNFSLIPSFQFQARYTTDYREEDGNNAVDGGAHTESGFEIRRMKFTFEGNVLGPDTRYKFQWNANSNTGTVTLEEAYVTHKMGFDRDIAIKAGQFKDVTFHEELTDSRRQLAVDRSLANEVLAGGQTDYVQGVGIIWDDGPDGLPIRGEAGFVDGPNSDNTNFVDAGGSPAFGVGNPDFGVYGRAEYLAFGDWKDYDDFTTLGNVQDTLVVGAGLFYTQAGDNEALFHTIDAQYEYNHLGLYAAYYGVYSDTEANGASYDFGAVIQAGYMLNDRWEIFGRYSLVSLDSGTAGNDDNFHELTAGANYYIKGHSAKFTFDLTYLPNGTPSNQSQIGALDPDADEDQFIFRGQFQLLL